MRHISCWSRLKLNGTQRLLVYADNVNLLGDNIDTVKKDTETLLEREYMLLSRHQNAGQSHNINIANGSFENVAQFMCLPARVTNQVILSSHVMSRSLQIKIHNYKFFPVILCVCKTLPVAPRKEHRLKVSEERVFRKILKKGEKKY
jgi:hypothetical protein